jgi:O-antigen ligase
LRLSTTVLRKIDHLSKPIDRHASLVFGVVAVVWLLATLGGGSARADVPFVVGVRVGAIVGLAIILVALPRERLRLAVTPLVFLGLIATIVAIQLIPLPHNVWISLPGREPYDDLRSVAGMGSLWRPISLTPDLTWNTLVSLAPPFFFVLAAPQLDRRTRFWLLIVLLVTIVLSAFLGMLQLAGGATSNLRWYHYTNEASAVGFFANRNHESVFLAMGIPLVAWWALQGRDRGRLPARLVVAAATTLFLLVAVATSQSRMGLFVAGLSLLLTAGFLLRQIRISRRSLAWAGGALLIVGGLTATGLTQWSSNRLSASGVEDDLRIKIFPETMEAARAYFPVGSGFGTFPNVFRRFENVEDLDEFYVNHTHSEPTQLLIEGGIFSVALLLLFAGWYARATFRAWCGSGSKMAEEARLASILVLLPLVGSITDYPIRAPLLACALAVAATLLHLTTQRTEKSR